MRCSGPLKCGVNAGYVGQRQQERERENCDHQRGEYAPIIVGELERILDKADSDQAAAEPALRPQIIQKPFGNKHCAQCYRQHKDCRQKALLAHQPNAHGDWHRKQYADQRDRNCQPQRSSNGLVKIRIGEELAVIGQCSTAIQRIERQHKTVQKRIDENTDYKEQCGQDQQRDTIETTIGKPLTQTGFERCIGKAFLRHGLSLACKDQRVARVDAKCDFRPGSNLLWAMKDHFHAGFGAGNADIFAPAIFNRLDGRLDRIATLFA
ncbi:hypothetical protein D9M70_502470 [compost metagenome]